MASTGDNLRATLPDRPQPQSQQGAHQPAVFSQATYHLNQYQQNSTSSPVFPQHGLALPNGSSFVENSHAVLETLEDRLRSMILNNDATAFTPTPTPVTTDSADPFQQQPLPRPQQQRLQSRQNDAKLRSKRPNQAQRRQMSARVSVVFDPRPPLPHVAQPHVSRTAGTQCSGTRPQRSYSRHSQSHHKSSLSHLANLHPPQYSHDHEQNQYACSAGSWRRRNQIQHGDSEAYLLPFHAPFPCANQNQNANNRVYDRRCGYGHNYTRSECSVTRPPLSFSDLNREAALLDKLAGSVLENVEIEPVEIAEKESFRLRIDAICRRAIYRHEIESGTNPHFTAESIQLACFGSLSSGFATKASDMDLSLLSPLSRIQPEAPDSPIPRLLEKTLLDEGFGARLITRTRVPIIKLCEKPTPKLVRDLLEERKKWENGILNENPDALDDDLQEENQDLPVVTNAKDMTSRDLVTTGDLDREEYARRIESLKQKSGQSLSRYYGAAKRVLRKLGGRNVRNFNAANFTANDLQVLTDVCRAYVKGLSEPTLRQRLLRYQSLAFPQPTTMGSVRSLVGVNYQVEGEVLLMAWDARDFKEKDNAAEKACQRIIDEWKELQQRAEYGTGPQGYTKELERGLERLRKIPTLQLKFLEQGIHETANEYYQRASYLLLELGGRDTPTCPRDLSRFIEYYIAGIHNEQIRASTRSFFDQLPLKLLLPVAHRQKTLHLALMYERATEKGLYSDEQAKAIRAYIAILRAPLNPGVEKILAYCHRIPITDENRSTILAVRTIPDPAGMACNQPRDHYRDRLEFPSSGVGVQCDVNFSAHLALQNTRLLRCYSHTDSRVRPLVLFVKHWAKMRNINDAYRGTLNSYGFVLMMLHYLVNVAEPFVCPNLQQLAPPPDPNISQAEFKETTSCRGCDVRFWGDEAAIQELASRNMLTQNRETVGQLLRGFFEYYAERGLMRDGKHWGFDWGRDVLSLRTRGGLLSKQQKGWTGARTVIHARTVEGAVQSLKTLPAGTPNTPAEMMQPSPLPHSGEFKEVRHRYLFAIEDPFEIDHNVARTVTHNGIVAIRDEFRRAWKIIQEAGIGTPQEGLLVNVKDGTAEKEQGDFRTLMVEIHGG